MDQNAIIKSIWGKLFHRFQGVHYWSQKVERKRVAFDLRRRYNPHHPPEQVREEMELFRADIARIQKEAEIEFHELKDLYVQYRNEIQPLVEKFTQEEREIYDAIERCLSDDIDGILLEENNGQESID